MKPLEAHWDTVSESQKRKWIELSRNYPQLPPAEKKTLHERMTEWASLSSRERVQARLNFAEVKQLAPQESKAKWEAYQALSDGDRRKLADDAPVRPRSAAVPVRPVPAQKLVQVPPPLPKGEHSAKIQLLTPPSAVAPAMVMPKAPMRPPIAPASGAAPAQDLTPVAPSLNF